MTVDVAVFSNSLTRCILSHNSNDNTKDLVTAYQPYESAPKAFNYLKPFYSVTNTIQDYSVNQYTNPI